MRVVIDREAVTRTVRLYALTPEHARVYGPGMRDEWQPVEQGAIPSPYLVIDEDLWVEFVREWLSQGGVVDADPLQDARAVRDRMIALVEKTVESAILPRIQP